MKPLLLCLFVLATAPLSAADGNRLAYLDDDSPFWPTRESPRFTTPQWIGEEGVEAAVIISIDDLREPAKYEGYLRPILERLKAIDGRAPASVFCNQLAPEDPQFQTWLKEGVSLEVHTLTHPCPLLKGGTGDPPVPSGDSPNGPFQTASQTYHNCVDLLAKIPSNTPLAYRMPCCDSMNSASPRFYAEIFSKQSAEGRHLAIDSSVMCLLTPKDKTLPRELVLDADGADRFRKYFPTEMKPPTKLTFERFAGYIEDYPYPYVIKGGCWEFPCIVPSDWEAFNAHGAKNPRTTEDWKAALDAVVLKQGVMTMVLHPHGWSDPKQIVELIDHAVAKYGKRVKFLNFPEALARLEKNALGGQSLRSKDGGDAKQRLIDVNGDALMDIATPLSARVWDAAAKSWRAANDREKSVAAGWPEKAQQYGDGKVSLPKGVARLNERGEDNGLRFVDLNGDGFDDILFSNEERYGIYLWNKTVRPDLGWNVGWSHLVRAGKRTGAPNEPPPFVRAGPHRNNGAWFKDGHLVVQNEDTAKLEAVVDRRSFKELIAFDIPPPKSSKESLAALQARPGFTVELVAAEPLVVDPVAFEWDAQGRLWVAEMRDYPSGMDGKGAPGGVIKVLEDADGDGRYDKAATFLENVPFPTGVMPWRKGALICAAPEIFYAEDTNGDGRADVRRALFTGFTPGNQQHRANGFEWGMDGWIYGANGDSGGEIKSSAGGSAKPVPISGRDFRFRPDTGEFESESGQTQYGRRRDDWGNWFGNNNPTWLWHYTVSDNYLRRNPKLAVKSVRQVLANYDSSTRVFPISEQPIRFNQPQSLGHVTSACSPAPYRDDLFGPDFATSVFISEPVHNVVHREVLEPDGATFKSHRADDEKEREFLASKDVWFRPTMLKTGPDGALYIADMYRFVLEHPEWIAPETQARLDLRAGSDKGRIYRVFPEGKKPRAIPKLAALDHAALVAALDSPSGWQRDTAQRLLFERKARDAAPALHELFRRATDPKVRVQSLATLETLQSLDAHVLRAAIRDAHPQVRAQALRSSESLATPELLAAVLACLNDPEFIVRHQLAYSLGAWRNGESEAALAQLAERDGAQAEMRVAILASLVPESALFAKLNAAPPASSQPASALPKPSTADRAKVVAAYAKVGELKGDAARGQLVFQQQCVICHRLKGEGQEVGPDLGAVGSKPLEWLLAAIFDPNAAIEPRYQAQNLKLKAGGELAGIIVAETGNNVTLRLPGGAEHAILRSDIAEQTSTHRSLMPDGLEAALAPQDVADLLEALRAP